MTTSLRILLALASITFLSLIVGCDGGGSLGNDDDDDSIADDDDDATDHPQMSVVTITAPLPGIYVVLTRSDGERTTLECTTPACTTALEEGLWNGTCELEEAICFPFQIEVANAQPAGHSLDIGYVHNGTYVKYLEDCANASTENGTFEISTEQGINEVIIRGAPGGNYRSEGDHLAYIGSSSAYGTTLEPNRMFELHTVAGDVRCFIRE